MTSKVTLSTIAEALSVSTATVSLALRDSPLIADHTKSKIKQKAQDMGYIYNRRAASLRTSKSGIIGVLVHDISNPYFAEILLAIEDELGLNQKTFLLCNHRDKLEIQSKFVETLLQFGADGVIVCPAMGTGLADIKKIEAAGLPVVLVARAIDGARVPAFRGDDQKGIYMATRYQIKLGHSEIAFIGGQRDTSTGRDRRQGYAAALEMANLPVREELQMGSQNSRRAGYDCIRQMYDNGLRPTAVVCFNDLVAIGVMSALRDMGLEPGKDVSVTGYDDISEAEIAAPALTTVWNGQEVMGRRAAQAMIDTLNDNEAEKARILIEPELRIRASTCPPPA